MTFGSLPRPLINEIVERALLEDLGRAGDITSAATIPPQTMAEGQIAARKAGTVCGLDLARAAFGQLDPKIVMVPATREGASVKQGQTIATLEGPAIGILSGERTALNFLGHLSGIATATATFAAAIAHTKARITCTRKTTPLLRALEKYAVKVGGGSNHRFGLDDAILIKDNHIAVAGSVSGAIERAKDFAGHLVKVEVEVDTLDQLREALTAAPDVILLDNMPPDLLREAVAINDGQAVLEASGGIDLERVAAVAETGVDFISSGWITHSAPSLDVGLDLEVRT